MSINAALSKSVADSVRCSPDSSPKRPTRTGADHAVAVPASVWPAASNLFRRNADGYLITVLDQVIFLDRFDEGPP